MEAHKVTSAKHDRNLHITIKTKKILPISGTDKATVMATQTKKAGKRIWEKRPFVFLLAQWNLLTMRPWNWLSFNHHPSNLKLPWPSSTSGAGDEESSALSEGRRVIISGKDKKDKKNEMKLSYDVCVCVCKSDNADLIRYCMLHSRNV